MKGFTRDNKFIPMTDYKKVTRKSRDSQTMLEGIRLKRDKKIPVYNTKVNWDNKRKPFKMWIVKHPEGSDVVKGSVTIVMAEHYGQAIDDYITIWNKENRMNRNIGYPVVQGTADKSFRYKRDIVRKARQKSVNTFKNLSNDELIAKFDKIFKEKNNENLQLQREMNSRGVYVNRDSIPQSAIRDSQQIMSPLSGELNEKTEELINRVKGGRLPKDVEYSRNTGVPKELGEIWDSVNVPTRALLLNKGFALDQDKIGFEGGQEAEITKAGMIWKDSSDNTKKTALSGLFNLRETKSQRHFMDEMTNRNELLERGYVRPEDWNSFGTPPYIRWTLLEAFDIPFYPFVNTVGKFKDLPERVQDVLSGRVNAKGVVL